MNTDTAGIAIIPEAQDGLALPADLRTDTPLWSFALSCWDKREIAAACLSLQQQGWSVTRILCACWQTSQGKPYDHSEDTTLTEWRKCVTVALRSIKKSIPKNLESCRELRAGVANMELEAERIELALAWHTLSTQSGEHTMQDLETLGIANLTAAAPTAGNTDAAAAEIHQLIAALALSRPGAQPT